MSGYKKEFASQLCCDQNVITFPTTGFDIDEFIKFVLDFIIMFYRLGYPKMIVMVTSKHKDKDNIITLAWHSPISHKPPLYGISVTPNRFSYNLIKRSKEFAINFIDNNLRGEALYCGTHTGKIVDKFVETGLHRKRAKVIKAPLIREAIAWIECRVVDEIKIGDHSLFIGKVVSTADTKRKSRLYDKGGRIFIQI